MPKSLSPEDLPKLLEPGMSVYMPNCAGESLLFAKVLQENTPACAGIRFIGVWIPGVNQIDYAALHDEARATSFFVTPALRKSFAAGKVDKIYSIDVRDNTETDMMISKTSLIDCEENKKNINIKRIKTEKTIASVP